MASYYIFAYTFAYSMGVMSCLKDKKLMDDLKIFPLAVLIPSILFMNIPLLISMTYFVWWLKFQVMMLLFRITLWKIKRKIRKMGKPLDIDI